MDVEGPLYLHGQGTIVLPLKLLLKYSTGKFNLETLQAHKINLALEYGMTPDFVDFVIQSFRAMETGLANELNKLIKFYNKNFAFDEFNKVEFSQVQKLAKTCSTGCEIADTGHIDSIPVYHGFSSKLVKIAFENN